MRRIRYIRNSDSVLLYECFVPEGWAHELLVHFPYTPDQYRVEWKEMTDDDADGFDFEAVEAIENMGKFGLSVYRSVLRDGGTPNEAFSVTGAFFAGMMKGSIQSGTDESTT